MSDLSVKFIMSPRWGMPVFLEAEVVKGELVIMQPYRTVDPKRLVNLGSGRYWCGRDPCYDPEEIRWVHEEFFRGLSARASDRGATYILLDNVFGKRSGPKDRGYRTEADVTYYAEIR